MYRYIFVPQVMLKTAIQKYLSSINHVQNYLESITKYFAKSKKIESFEV